MTIVNFEHHRLQSALAVGAVAFVVTFIILGSTRPQIAYELNIEGLGPNHIRVPGAYYHQGLPERDIYTDVHTKTAKMVITNVLDTYQSNPVSSEPSRTRSSQKGNVESVSSILSPLNWFRTNDELRKREIDSNSQIRNNFAFSEEKEKDLFAQKHIKVTMVSRLNASKMLPPHILIVQNGFKPTEPHLQRSLERILLAGERTGNGRSLASEPKEFKSRLMNFVIPVVLIGVSSGILFCAILFILSDLLGRCRRARNETCKNDGGRSHFHGFAGDVKIGAEKDGKIDSIETASASAPGTHNIQLKKAEKTQRPILPPLHDDVDEDAKLCYEPHELLELAVQDKSNSLSRISTMTDSAIDLEECTAEANFTAEADDIHAALKKIVEELLEGNTIKSGSELGENGRRKTRYDHSGELYSEDSTPKKENKSLRPIISSDEPGSPLAFDQHEELKEACSMDESQVIECAGQDSIQRDMKNRAQQRMAHAELEDNLENILGSYVKGSGSSSPELPSYPGSWIRDVYFVPMAATSPPEIVENLGLDVVGAYSPSSYPMVTHVSSGSPFVERIHEGDEVYAINSENVRGLSRVQVLAHLNMTQPNTSRDDEHCASMVKLTLGSVHCIQGSSSTLKANADEESVTKNDDYHSDSNHET